MLRVDADRCDVGEFARGGQVKGEFDALRRVARLASDHVARAAGAGLGAEAATLQALRAALEDLERRYPYTLEPRSLADELRARASSRP